MTSVRAALAGLAKDVGPIEGAPDVEWTLAPGSPEEAARILDLASEHRLRVLLWGGGSHQGYGGRVDADVLVSSARLHRIVEWEKDDLTLVVEAGARVAAVEERLREGGQTALLPESPDDATVGGVVAAGASGWRRGKYGPTRDRMLEVLLITGDGRTVRGGGRVVKNVTGYDLPRLAAGSFGALGMIARVCLKLWPAPEAAATVSVDDPERSSAAFRPLAIIEDREQTKVFLGGHPADVEAQVAALGGLTEPGHNWPAPLSEPILLSLRVPPRLVIEARSRLRKDWSYQIEHGVGQIGLGCPTEALNEMSELRLWAESVGGSLVVVNAPSDFYSRFDPWGRPPASQEIQRRLVAQFDPLRVLNPGRLPGAL